MTNILNSQFPPDLSAIYDEKLANQLANTQGAIGSLSQMVLQLHNPTLLMHPLLDKEAESSSQLEGTQASIEDVYKEEIEDQSPEKRGHIQEIRNYREAMLDGYEMVKKNIFSEAIIRGMHKTLMQGVRGRNKHPGEYRKGDVWVGKQGTSKDEARYIPPEAIHIDGFMDELVSFIKDRGEMNPLIACGVIHHRFEAIHPFEDGNGRTGRLIISTYLINQGLMTLPMLYPSGYFEKNKNQYVDVLHSVDEKENWYEWLLFFLKGLEVQAKLTLKVGLEIDNLFKVSRELIEQDARSNIGLLKVLEHSFSSPYLTAPLLHKRLKINKVTASRYLNKLAAQKIISFGGTYQKSKFFMNSKLLDILREI